MELPLPRRAVGNGIAAGANWLPSLLQTPGTAAAHIQIAANEKAMIADQPFANRAEVEVLQRLLHREHFRPRSLPLVHRLVDDALFFR